MLSPEHQELLSAHFDGELADEERAQVDALLNESQEARELLQEFDEISAALRDAEVPETPAEIRTAVLDRIAKAAPAAPQPRSRRRAWQRWLAPALAASLALAVAVWVQTPQPPARTVPQIADAITVPASPDRLDLEGAGIEAATEVPPRALAFQLDNERRTPTDARRRFGDLSTNGFAAPPEGAPSTLSERLFPHGSDPVPGETRTLLGQQGEAPVLVNYTVVDVEKAAGRMRVLLSQNGIHEVAARSRAPEAEVAAPARKTQEENRLFALYVEAPQDQVVAALNDIDGIREVVDVDADYVELSDNLSVAAEALPYRMQQKWMAADQSSVARGRASPAPVESRPVESAATANPNPELDESTRLPRQDGVDATKPAEVPPQPGAVGGGFTNNAGRAGDNLAPRKRDLAAGKGVQMQVSEEQLEKLMLLRSNQRRLAESHQLALPSPSARPPAPPAPEPLDSEPQATEQGLTGRRVKVLLILQGQQDQ